MKQFIDGFTYCTHILVIDLESKMSLVKIDAEELVVLELYLQN